VSVQKDISGTRTILMILALAVLILIVIYTMGTYRYYSCSSLCISGLSEKGNYALQAKISFYNESLPNAMITIITNNAYKGIIQTSPSSTLNFRAPLNLGPNSMILKYNGSETIVRFFYLGGMLYLLLIPLGVLCLLLARLLPSEFAKRDKIIFYPDAGYSTNDKQPLKNAIDVVTKKSKRIIKGLPESVSDVSSELALASRNDGHKTLAKCPTYLSQKIEKERIAFSSYGAVTNNPFSKEVAIARWFYEHSIMSGQLTVFDAKTPAAFLAANQIIFKKDVTLPILSKMAGTKSKIRLVLFGYGEMDEFSRLMKSYSKMGATLLMLRAENLLETIVFCD
jgi:hypothetical protein